MSANDLMVAVWGCDAHRDRRPRRGVIDIPRETRPVAEYPPAIACRVPLRIVGSSALEPTTPAGLQMIPTVFANRRDLADRTLPT